MAHSNSSLSLFTDCMAKYEHAKILHSKPCKPPSPHLTFGTMAHDVLYKAGVLRDQAADGVVIPGEYNTVIPSELLYPELQQEFQIHSWQRYFVPIITRVAEYEKQVVKELQDEFRDICVIEREVKLQMNREELANIGYTGFDQSVVGIIDFLAVGTYSATILDYKFSSSKKTQDDFDMNSQLYLYAMFVHMKYDIPLHNIKVGYIDIPKQMFDSPTVLTNGTLSRSKSQNVLPELYKKAVEAIHGNDEKYNCEPGGYYYDCYMALSLNDVAYLSIQYLDEEAYSYIVDDLLKCAKLIDKMIREKIPFVRKHSAYSCKSCEFIDSCKPWTTINKGEIE